jgi:hypothetical protein
MPVWLLWYMLVYTSTSQYENLIPVYTDIYLDVRNRLVSELSTMIRLGDGCVKI